MTKITFTAKQSDGSDGYTAGTWEGVVTCTEPNGSKYESYDGGYSCRKDALAWARKRAASYIDTASS